MCLHCMTRGSGALSSITPRPHTTGLFYRTSRNRATHTSSRTLSQCPYCSSSHVPIRGAQRQERKNETFPRTSTATASSGRPRHYATTTEPTPASRPKLTSLDHRRLLVVHGQDAAHFLQGLTTNNVPTTWASSARDGFYSAFLNAQGRLLHDVFIYPATACGFYQDSILPEHIKNKKSAEEPGFVIEADAEGIQNLSKHLKRYRLRAKVDIWVLDPGQASLLAAFGASNGEGSGNVLPRETEALRCIDNRSPGFATRVVTRPDSEYERLLKQKLDVTALPWYQRARHMAGIPEGQASTGGELPYAASLPHETNVDLMSGVDFRKGCYVGQELTIRTQHKGVVRKRILPVSLYSTSGAGETDLVKQVQDWAHSGAAVDIVAKGRRGRPAGRWVSGVPTGQLGLDAGQVSSLLNGEVGLAIVRLEMMTDLVVEAGGDGGGVRFKDGDEFVLRPKWEDGRKEEDAGIGIRAHVPAWIREDVESRAKKGEKNTGTSAAPMEPAVA